MSGARTLRPEQHVVRIGELRIANGGAVLYTLGLGSCVAVALYEREASIGGLAHVMLPTPADARVGSPPGRFASTAIDVLAGMMIEVGVRQACIRAKIVGGSSMFTNVLPDGGRALGRRNVEAVRTALAAASIPLEAEDVGGDHGRSVYLHTADGRVRVRSVKHGDIEL